MVSLETTISNFTQNCKMLSGCCLWRQHFQFSHKIAKCCLDVVSGDNIFKFHSKLQNVVWMLSLETTFPNNTKCCPNVVSGDNILKKRSNVVWMLSLDSRDNISNKCNWCLNVVSGDNISDFLKFLLLIWTCCLNIVSGDNIYVLFNACATYLILTTN